MKFPVSMVKKRAENKANYRWFAAFYIVASFFVIPLIVFALSLAG
jgi:hypothetical protein